MGRRLGFLKLNRRERTDNGGFSLLEVIIAMAILAIITIPLLNYFTSSMRNSARMAQRQNATLTAQEITERLKAEDKLIIPGTVSGNSTIYQVPYLTEKLGFSPDKVDEFNEAEGTGKIVFLHKAEEDERFDVRVTLSTNISANTVERSLVYGIDDATDMLIIEQAQEEEASVYYTAAYMKYCAQHPELTAGSPMTADDILSHLERWICFDISYSTSDNLYTVRAYYDYITKDTSVTGEAGGHCIEGKRFCGICDNCMQGKHFASSYLIEAKVSSLKNIYLLYNRLGGNLNDTVYVLNGLSAIDETKEIDEKDKVHFYLLCQNLPKKSSTEESSTEQYNLNVSGSSDKRLVYHSNAYENPAADSAFKPLAQKGKPVRLIEIITEVYEKGHSESGEDPLATMTTTKGE